MDDEIGLDPIQEVGEEGGLGCLDVADSTLVMVYVYLSVVMGMEALMPCEFISGLPRS